MKTLITTCCLIVAVLFGSTQVRADDLERLIGKWSVSKTNDQGQAFTQTIEIQKDKFVFKIIGSDGETRIYAEGEFKLEKLGPFSVARFAKIKAGQSASEAEPIDDDRTVVYQLGYNTWTLGSNFDKERDQAPNVDVYKKVTSSK